jgi:hypothetical protein
MKSIYRQQESRWIASMELEEYMLWYLNRRPAVERVMWTSGTMKSGLSDVSTV